MQRSGRVWAKIIIAPMISNRSIPPTSPHREQPRQEKPQFNHQGVCETDVCQGAVCKGAAKRAFRSPRSRRSRPGEGNVADGAVVKVAPRCGSARPPR